MGEGASKGRSCVSLQHLGCDGEGSLRAEYIPVSSHLFSILVLWIPSSWLFIFFAVVYQNVTLTLSASSVKGQKVHYSGYSLTIM